MNASHKSIIPSQVALPAGGGFETIYAYFLFRFPRIPESVWRERFELDKVHFADGAPVRLETPYQANRHIFYYREVPNEKKIPFEERVVFENDDFLVADKPHFLPVHPAGNYVNETLITRLRTKYGYEELGNAHRIDRLTAGLVLCVKTREKRGIYQQLFREEKFKKTYLAAGKIPAGTDQTHWHIQARMEPSEDYFRMRIVAEGPANSESFIERIERRGEMGLFRLRPITGKKHQLRVHLCAIGSGVLNLSFAVRG